MVLPASGGDAALPLSPQRAFSEHRRVGACRGPRGERTTVGAVGLKK